MRTVQIFIYVICLCVYGIVHNVLNLPATHSSIQKNHISKNVIHFLKYFSICPILLNNKLIDYITYCYITSKADICIT